MSIDPRSPVLVGAGAVSQRIDDPTAAREPIELVIEALERAAEDAGNRDLLRRADVIRTTKGFPPYPAPGKLIAERVGADARTELADIGILQTTPLARSVIEIAAGRKEIVLVAGGEAKYRALRAQMAGTEPTYTEQGATKPDQTLRPHDEIMSDSELIHGLAMPVNQYALMENALRFAEGKTLAQHVREIAELWSAMSRVAAGNPDAWIRDALSAEEIASTDRGNRMLAYPYTKRHNSQWNVDQAAGLILCSVEAARRLGIAEDRWVHPRAIAESNHMVPLCERAELHRSHGFRIAGARALGDAGVTIDDVQHRELYSCFPVAVRIQARELAIDPSLAVTVTGGMAFAGGPLNNFVLQAMVKMVEVLREAPGDLGLVTAVSGLLTKQGVSLWSTRPGSRPARCTDVSDVVARELARIPVVADYTGHARIAAATVLYEPTGPRAAFICDTTDARRTIASTPEPAVVAATLESEPCGRILDLAPGRVRFA